MAEDEIVEIVPNIRMEALNMICVRVCPPPTKLLLIISPRPLVSSYAHHTSISRGFSCLLPTFMLSTV